MFSYQLLAQIYIISFDFTMVYAIQRTRARTQKKQTNAFEFGHCTLEEWVNYT